MIFPTSVVAVGGCTYNQPDDPGNLEMDWLEVQLKIFRDRGMQVSISQYGLLPLIKGSANRFGWRVCFFVPGYHANIDTKDGIFPGHVPPSRLNYFPECVGVFPSVCMVSEITFLVCALCEPGAQISRHRSVVMFVFFFWVLIELNSSWTSVRGRLISLSLFKPVLIQHF